MPNAPGPAHEASGKVAPIADVARFGRRFAAICLDWLVSIGVSLILFPRFAYGSPESSAATLLIFATEVIAFTWLISASFGQRILGILVVRSDGSRLSLWRVIARTVLICLVIPALVYDAYGRGLHDRAVDSLALRRSGLNPGK